MLKDCAYRTVLCGLFFPSHSLVIGELDIIDIGSQASGNWTAMGPSILMDGNLSELELSHAEKSEAFSTQLIGSELEAKLTRHLL